MNVMHATTHGSADVIATSLLDTVHAIAYLMGHRDQTVVLNIDENLRVSYRECSDEVTVTHHDPDVASLIEVIEDFKLIYDLELYQLRLDVSGVFASSSPTSAVRRYEITDVRELYKLGHLGRFTKIPRLDWSLRIGRR